VLRIACEKIDQKVIQIFYLIVCALPLDVAAERSVHYFYYYFIFRTFLKLHLEF
jgi:hypothetical protein